MNTRFFLLPVFVFAALFSAAGQPFVRTFSQGGLAFLTEQSLPVAGGFVIRAKKSGSKNAWIDLRIDDEGDLISQATFVCPSPTTARFFRMADGGCLAVQVLEGSPGKILVKKFRDGGLVFSQTVTVGANQLADSGLELFSELPGEGFLLGGLLEEFLDPTQTSSIEHTFLMKFGENGSPEWSRWLDFNANFATNYRRFHLLESGDLFAEVRETTGNASHYYVQKLGQTGDPVFQTKVQTGGSPFENPWLVPTADGGFLSFGTAKNVPTGGQFFLRKFDEAGQKQWEIDNSALFSPNLIDFNAGGEVSHLFALPDPNAPGGFLAGGKLKKSGGQPTQFFLQKTDATGHAVGLPKLLPGVPQTFSTARFLADGQLLVGGSVNGSPWLMRTGMNGAAPAATIFGKIFADVNENCLFDSGEKLLGGWQIALENAGTTTHRATTNSEGRFEMQVDSGSFQVRPVLPGSLWEACSPSQMVATGNAGSPVFELNFPIQPVEMCPQMRVDLAAPTMEACQPNPFFVRYFNDGPAPANDVKIYLDLTQQLDFQASTIQPTSVAGTVYLFKIGEVPVNSGGGFRFTAIPKCDLDLGAAVCPSAQIVPGGFCGVPPGSWSGAVLQVSGECVADSIRFHVKNVGTGLSQPLEYIITEDIVILTKEAAQPLEPGKAFKLTKGATGKTFRLFARQEVGFPEKMTLPTVAVEGCEGPAGGISYGFVTQFSDDAGSRTTSVECREVTAAGLANGLSASPQGIDNQHFIRRDGPIDYLLKFQNLGNDTARLVILRDTLDAGLDAGSVQFLAASHPCLFQVVGGGVVKAVFTNLVLPDSMSDNAGSRGWLKFRAVPRADILPGSVIQNRAAAILDGQPVAISNQVFHTIDTAFWSFGGIVKTIDNQGVASDLWAIFPNPAAGGDFLFLKKSGDAKLAFFEENLTACRLVLFDLSGKTVWETAGQPGGFPLKNGLPGGTYFFEIHAQNGRSTMRGRLVVF